MSNYAAGIVLYNPDLKRLKQNIDAVFTQVQKVYCFDNGSKNIEEIYNLVDGYRNVILMGGGENLGIATALNKIMDQANKDMMEWVLTLDQDSVVCDKMIESLASLKSETNVLIICPIIEDIRRKNETVIAPTQTYEDVDFCITSGSFLNLERLLNIGGFNDWLFIGLVDNEVCVRIKQKGYRIIRNNYVVLNHELGNLTPSRYEGVYLKVGEILHIDSIKKLSYKRTVNPMRLYYATRNMIYLNYIYPKNRIEAWSTKKLVENCISSLLRGKNKIEILKAIAKGIKDGKEKCSKR